MTARCAIEAVHGRLLTWCRVTSSAWCFAACCTFNPYKPAIIDWPVLDAEARERLVSLPIWDIAVQTEGKARQRMLSYAASLADPLARGHGAERLGGRAAQDGAVQPGRAPTASTLAPEPAYLAPRDPEWAYLVTGFRMHRQLLRLRPVRTGPPLRLLPAGAGRHLRAGDAGGMPPHPVCSQLAGLAREAMPRWRRPWFFLQTAVLGFRERIQLARDVSGGQKQDANFTVSGASSVGDGRSIPPTDGPVPGRGPRRLDGYDPRLSALARCPACPSPAVS